MPAALEIMVEEGWLKAEICRFFFYRFFWGCMFISLCIHGDQ